MKRIPATTENVKSWEDIPLVKLGKILKQMVWFTGKYTYVPEYNEVYYKNHIFGLNSARLEMQYRKQEIIILCDWEEGKKPSGYSLSDKQTPDRFAIGIETPYHDQFQARRSWVDNKIIFKHARFYSAAIDKIENAMYNAQEVIDKRIAEDEADKKREAELKITRENLCKNLDVPIAKDKYGNNFLYRKDCTYHLNFESEDETGEFFTIEEIGGAYTQDDIKKIIEIVGGNPRAVAERLTK